MDDEVVTMVKEKLAQAETILAQRKKEYEEARQTHIRLRMTLKMLNRKRILPRKLHTAIEKSP